MLLVLSSDQKEHLSLLSEVDEVISREFCRIAVEFIKSGINPKKYQVAAQKLNVDIVNLRQCVEAIMHILSECTKLQINEIDFQDSIITLDISDELKGFLLELYMNNRDEIRSTLSDMSLILPHFKNLEWRFDVQLASRMMSYQTTPEILMRWHIDNGISTDTHVLQTDPVNLIHLTKVLEEALGEMKTAHCRRIARNIK